MADQPTPARLIRFGLYEADLSADELRKEGRQVRLQGRPFEVLRILLERPGEVISRERFRELLWPADTFVDFDHSLSTSINKLRQALNDDAKNPRFVATVGSRGYRFIAPVSSPDESAATNTTSTLTRNADLGTEDVSSGDLNNRTPWLRRWRLLHGRFYAVAAAAVILAGVWTVARSRAKPVLAETDLVLVSDFANTTGDPVFDDTLKQAISAQLAQSPFLNILSEAKIRATLRLMTKPANTKLTPDVARDLCQRTDSKAYLAGSIASLGSQYVIALNAINCRTGEFLAQEQVTAERKELVLRSLGEAATKIRQRLGESLGTIQKFDTPIEAVTTPSLEALQAFSVGMKTMREKGAPASIPSFQRAIELDPNFAVAYAALGISYTNMREPGLAGVNLQKAYDLRNRVSEREKFGISAYYYHLVTGDLEKAIETYQLWAQTYPRDSTPPGNLAVNHDYLGQYEKAVAETLEDIRLTPYSGVAYTNLVSHYAALDRLDEAKSSYDQALLRKLENPFLHGNRYGVAFLEGDAEEMQRQISWATGKTGAEDLLLSYASDTEAFSGRLATARKLSQRAVESALRSEAKETAANWQMNAALREAEFGDASNARQASAAALTLDSSRDLQVLAALVLARAGDSARAERMANDLAKRFPLNTAINDYWLPAIRAAIEIDRKDPARAVEMLQAATPYDRGNPLPQVEVGACMYPVYLRGESYLQLNRGKEAAAEFQPFRDHRGVTVNCPLGALARRGLARAYALEGDTQGSRKEYSEFLILWKDADPGLTVLKEAKSEFAKLSARPTETSRLIQALP